MKFHLIRIGYLSLLTALVPVPSASLTAKAAPSNTFQAIRKGTYTSLLLFHRPNSTYQKFICILSETSAAPNYRLFLLLPLSTQNLVLDTGTDTKNTFDHLVPEFISEKDGKGLLGKTKKLLCFENSMFRYPPSLL